MYGELPRAQVRSTSVAGRLTALRGDLGHWTSTRAQWLLPRVVPVALAGLGLIAILSFTWALARTTMGVYPAQVDRPTVIYLVRIRPPATGATVLGATMTTLGTAPVAVPSLRDPPTPPATRAP